MRITHIISSLIIWGCMLMNANNKPFNLLTEDQKPSKPLLELLELLEVNHDGTLKGIVEITQKRWLRRPGTERWHMTDIHQDKRDKIFCLLDEIGVLKEIKPSKKCYDCLLFNGASVGRMQKRLSDLWKYGATFKTFVFLTGDRPLDPQVEPTKDLLYNKKAPTTEYETGRALFAQAQTPPQWRNSPLHVITDQQTDVPKKDGPRVVFVDAPMKKTKDGFARPTTGDTVALWLKSDPKPGSCLVISNQPYVGYQDTIVRSLIPKAFDIETIGAISTEQNIAVHLDNLARWLYAELHK